MNQPLPFDRAAVSEARRSLPSAAPETMPGGLLAAALDLMSRRRRARSTFAFRGFDRHQLRDLGLNAIDQW
jgi:hypothetical protein